MKELGVVVGNVSVFTISLYTYILYCEKCNHWEIKGNKTCVLVWSKYRKLWDLTVQKVSYLFVEVLLQINAIPSKQLKERGWGHPVLTKIRNRHRSQRNKHFLKS